MRTFAGKTLLITGASEGIGKALALELAAEGANLVLLARNGARLEEAVRECRARGAQAEAVAGDVTSREDCERCVARALQRFGALDVLVNNAGVTMWARFDAVHDFAVYERLLADQLPRRGVHDRRRAGAPEGGARADRGGRQHGGPHRAFRSAPAMRPASTPWSASLSRCASSSPAAASMCASWRRISW